MLNLAVKAKASLYQVATNRRNFSQSLLMAHHVAYHWIILCPGPLNTKFTRPGHIQDPTPKDVRIKRQLRLSPSASIPIAVYQSPPTTNITMNNNMVSPTSQTGPRPKAETSTSQGTSTYESEPPITKTRPDPSGPTEGPQAAETAPANSDQQNRQLPVAGTEFSNVPAPGPNPSSGEQLDHSNATPYPTETGRTPRSKPDGKTLPLNHSLKLLIPSSRKLRHHVPHATRSSGACSRANLVVPLYAPISRRGRSDGKFSDSSWQ